MLTILHVSDLHFGPPFVPPVGEALLRIAPTLDCDLIVASGDFTQRATEQQFIEAETFLARLPKLPLVVTPGNHDIPLYRFWERIFTPYQHYQKHIAQQLDSVLRIERATIVSLNTTAPLQRITDGVIRASQLEYAADAFRSTADDDARIVVAHHHFAPPPDYDESHILRGGRAALDRFTDLKVDMVLGGHLHRAYIGNSLDVYPSKDRSHGIIIVQSGTTTSRRGRAREREKNSFNLIRVTENSVRVTHYMYFSDAGGFEPVSRHVFPRRSRQYFARGGED